MYCVLIDEEKVLDEDGDGVCLSEAVVEIRLRGSQLALPIARENGLVEILVPESHRAATWVETNKILTSSDFHNVLAMIEYCVPLLGLKVRFTRQN